jgi:hypothetical protein
VLTEVGLVRCTQITGQHARYEADRHNDHHHFVCRFCGDIMDVGCAIGEAPCLDAQLPESYQVDEAAVTCWGACPLCTRRARMAVSRHGVLPVSADPSRNRPSGFTGGTVCRQRVKRGPRTADEK